MIREKLTFTATTGLTYIMEAPGHYESGKGPTHGFAYWGTRDGKRFGPVRVATNHAGPTTKTAVIYRDGLAAWKIPPTLTSPRPGATSAPGPSYRYEG